MFCGWRNATKLEKSQERALRFVFMDSDSSYMDILKRGNFLSLSAYRIRNLAMEIFKCFHGMNPMYLNNLFCKRGIKYNLRDKTLLEQPKFLPKLTATGRSETTDQNNGIPFPCYTLFEVQAWMNH